jgi:hypothetical protein
VVSVAPVVVDQTFVLEEPHLLTALSSPVVAVVAVAPVPVVLVVEQLVRPELLCDQLLQLKVEHNLPVVQVVQTQAVNST